MSLRTDEKEAKKRAERDARWIRLSTAACIGSWFALNMAIANLNKWIFHQYDFRYPALLTSLHMLSCYALCSIVLRLRAKQMRPISQRAQHAVWQLSAVFVVSVTAGNGALGFIHVSFAQAIGATAPLWTVALSVLLTRKSYSSQVYVSLLLISAGMVLTTRGEVNFHPVGFALIVLATLTRALKSIMQGILLSSAEDRIDSIELLHQMSWRSALWLTGWCVVMERDALHDHALRDAGLWSFLIVSSLVAFFLNIAQFLVTKATSAVTLQVLGNIKVVMLILISVSIFGNEVSIMAACGCALCLSGVVLYNMVTRNGVATHSSIKSADEGPKRRPMRSA